MKKIIKIFLLIIIIIFILISTIRYIDKYNIKKEEKLIKDNTKINNIIYLNKYNNYYLIIDDKYLYLLNSNYDEIDKIEITKLKIYEEYDIIYEDNQIMYLYNYKEKDKLIFKYYDIYTNELIKEITF